MYNKIKKYLNRLITKRGRFFVFFIFLTFVLGLFVRIYMVFAKNIWFDESFYFYISKETSVVDILFANHWIVDNPPFIFLFYKMWSFFGNGVFWLRFPAIISFCLSFFLLARLLRKSDNKSLLFALSMYSFSVYFVFINSWISPYNFAITFCLVILNLLYDFIEITKANNFVLLFVVFNFLIINTHYSSLYLFMLYPFVLLYLFKIDKKKFKIFLKSLLFSLLASIPTLYLIISKRNEIYFLQNVENFYSFKSYFGMISYFIDAFLLRTSSFIANFKIGWVLLATYFVLVSKHFKFEKTIGLFLIFLFFPSTVFIYFFYKNTPTILAERALWVIHLSYILWFYLLITGIKKQKKPFYFLIFGFLITFFVLSFRMEFMGKSKLTPGGQVSDHQWSKKGYKKILSEVSESSDDGAKVFVLGYDKKDPSQQFVFVNYYLEYDNNLEKAKAINSSSIRQLIDAKNKGNKVLVINLYKSSLNKRYHESTLDGVEVINFWDYVYN